jgi:hypothetical protein
VVVTLFKADNQTGTGPVNGQLVGGTISNDMLEGPMAGKTLEGDLVKAIQTEKHTLMSIQLKTQMAQFVDR